MEQVIIQAEQTPAEGPNDAELAAKGESAVNGGKSPEEQQVQSSEAKRPEWVPEKFWNPDTGEVNYEGMAKSYSELEKAQSGKKPEGTIKIEDVNQAKELAIERGLDFDALAKEYSTQGNLSDETYKSLEAKGIPRDVVQQFVEGQQAQAQAQRQEVLKDVGGEDKYQEMTAWAKANLDAGDIEAYNRAMNSGDVGVIKLAIAALKGKFVEANGSPPKTQVGGKRTSNTLEPFQSRTQYVDAVKDARYQRDPAYRNEVLKRLEASTIF
jgi:hypothetical protein